MSIHMVADHAIRPAEDDVIFGIAGRAAARAKIVGAKNIINSTIGSLMDDDGGLIAFDCVYNELRDMDPRAIAAYAGLAGIPEFLESVVKACFMDHQPEGYIRAVATPGGTGAIRHSVCNFTNVGDTYITANWYWAPYQTIADENFRHLDTFNLFNEKNEFDFESYKEKFVYYLEKQGRILVILNTPAHNPTGYTISDDEWDMILDLAKEYAAKNPDYRISILCDIAYIDFAGTGTSARTFMEKFSNLPENIIGLFAYSASKSFTMYGLRNGAILCVTKSKEIADEFYYSCAHSNRGTWSNGTKCAMQVIANIYSDADKYAACEVERDKYRELLARRGAAFMKAVSEAKLPITNYRDGFFVSIPTDDPKALCEALIAEDLYTVPLQKGVRIALCAISEDAASRVPAMMKKALDELNAKK